MTVAFRGVPSRPAPTFRVGLSVDTTGTAAYHVFGDLDAGAVEEFRAVTAGAAGQPRVIIDLSGAGLVDAAGLGAITHLVRRIVDAGRAVAIVTTSTTLAALLDSEGVSAMAPIVASSAAAFRCPPAVLPDPPGGFPPASRPL